MKIREVRERTVPLSADISNAYVSFSSMTASLVAVESDVVRDGRPVTGYGFSSPGRYAQGEIIRDRAVPRLLAADPHSLMHPETGALDPFRANAALRQSEKPGGHGDRSVAIGAVDSAIWDLAAKLEDVPLSRFVGDLHGAEDPTASSVWVYAAGGYYSEGGSTNSLVQELTSYLDLGFSHVKMKIGGMPLEADRERVAAAVEAVEGGQWLAVDANGRFERKEALAYAEMLEPFGLLWYEEPGDPLDFEISRELAESYGEALATGENLFSAIDARNLLRYGGLRPDRDYLQMDPALSYGPSEFIRMVLEAETLGWPRARFVPHGGHQLNLALAAGLGLGGTECYPGVFAPIGGFLDDTPVVDGRVELTDVPGIGVEHKSDLWEFFAEL